MYIHQYNITYGKPKSCYTCVQFEIKITTINYETSDKDIVGRIGKRSPKNCIHLAKRMMHLHKNLNIEHSYDYVRLEGGRKRML